MRDFFHTQSPREVSISAGVRNFTVTQPSRMFLVQYGKNNVRGGFDRNPPAAPSTWETWGDTHLTIEDIVGTFEDYD